MRTAYYQDTVYNPPKDFKNFFIKRTSATEFLSTLKNSNNNNNGITDAMIDYYSKKDCLKASCAIEILSLYNEYTCTSIDSKSRRERPNDL